MSKIGGFAGTGSRQSHTTEVTADRLRFDAARERAQSGATVAQPARASAATEVGKPLFMDGVETVGERLADARKSVGMTQLQIAGLMGSTQPSLARFEKDLTQPNLRTVTRYADAIGYRVEAGLVPVDIGSPLPTARGIAIDGLQGELARLRREAGFTQVQVAARMQTTQPIVARFEKGEAGPNLRTLDRFAEAIGYHLELSLLAPD